MVNIPEFDDFFKFVTPEMCEKIEKRAALNIEKLKKCFDSNDFSGIKNELTGQNFRIMLGLLELYHEWLAEQLRKD